VIYFYDAQGNRYDKVRLKNRLLPTPEPADAPAA
jgi:hypothetical protein